MTTSRRQKNIIEQIKEISGHEILIITEYTSMSNNIASMEEAWVVNSKESNLVYNFAIKLSDYDNK